MGLFGRKKLPIPVVVLIDDDPGCREKASADLKRWGVDETKCSIIDDVVELVGLAAAFYDLTTVEPNNALRQMARNRMGVGGAPKKFLTLKELRELAGFTGYRVER